MEFRWKLIECKMLTGARTVGGMAAKVPFYSRGAQSFRRLTRPSFHWQLQLGAERECIFYETRPIMKYSGVRLWQIQRLSHVGTAGN